MNKTGLKRRVCIRQAKTINEDGKKINILIIPRLAKNKNDPKKQRKRITATTGHKYNVINPEISPCYQSQAAAAALDPTDVSRRSSKSSVIYVDSFDNSNCPIIDLTKSCTSLDTPSYKPKNNHIKMGNSRAKPLIISQRKRTTITNNNNENTPNKVKVIRTNSLLTRRQSAINKIRALIPSSSNNNNETLESVCQSPPSDENKIFDDILDLQNSYAERCLEGLENMNEPFFNTKIPLDTIMNSYGVTSNDSFNT